MESYKNGKLHGPEEWYSDTGVLDMMNLHENGVEIGKKYFNDEGALIGKLEKEIEELENKISQLLKINSRWGELQIVSKNVEIEKIIMQAQGEEKKRIKKEKN